MRHAITAGWLAGIIVLLAGLPLPLAVATPFLAAAGAFAWGKWGSAAWLGLRTGFRIKRLIKTAAKTGGAVERA